MENRYIVSVDTNHIVKISQPTSKTLVYRIPYCELKNYTINNRFIVYILVEEKLKEKDLIYVGKSKNFINNRPTAHTDKSKNWTYCYVLTTIEDGTFLNDGVCQYLENKICEKINNADKFENTTCQTNMDTVNSFEEIFCEKFLNEIIEMLEILNLTFEKTKENEKMEDETKEKIVPKKRTFTPRPQTYKIGTDTYAFVSWKQSLVDHCEKIIQKVGFDTFKEKVLHLQYTTKKSKRKLFGETEEDMRGFDFYKFREGELYLLVNYSGDSIRKINELLNDKFPETKLQYVY